VNDKFFDGTYKTLWRYLNPPQVTNTEVDWILTFLENNPKGKVLDLLCGYGRHALPLARKGFTVTAVDNLQEYISEIEGIKTVEELSVNTMLGNVLDFDAVERFNVIICMGNSLNFFAPHEITLLVNKIASLLEPAGTFLFHSSSIAEIALHHFNKRSWFLVKDIYFMHNSTLLLHPTRIETETYIQLREQEIERKSAIDYIYSINEFSNFFKAAGLKLANVLGAPMGNQPFNFGDRNAYFVIKKGRKN
jgi:2-polyprenyl-3-methyl-5-hydroxy-6-metoxy-1,4-benzoquinol methylase